MGSIVHKLLYNTRKLKDGLKISYLEMGIEGIGPAACGIINQLPRPRIMKTHLSYEFLQEKVEKENLKVIVVMRNPKDTITSLYYMYRGRIAKFPGNFHDFYQLFKAKQLIAGDIFQWNLDWWEKRHLPNVLVIKYEEMKEDLAGEILKIVAFLGLKPNAETISRILEEVSFKSMKSEALSEEPASPAGQERSARFFRNGIVGDWKNHFTKEETQYMDASIENYFKPARLTFND